MPRKNKPKYSLTLGVDCLLHHVQWSDGGHRDVQCQAGDKFKVIALGRWPSGVRYTAVIGVRGSGQIEYNEAHIMKEIE